jgi:hypothetical protein
MTTKTKTSEAEAEAAELRAARVHLATPAFPRKIPMIPPQNCKLDIAGMETSSYFVTLPADSILDDLKESSIWSAIQGGGARQGLRKHDKLVIIPDDESWRVEAVVTAATDGAATIAIVSKVSMPDRGLSLPGTDSHQIIYSGRGFSIKERRSGALHGNMVYGNLSEALLHLHALSQRRAG